MIRIFRRFFDFCGEINKRKFTKSIFLGVLKALFEALKIPAIAVTLHGVLSGNLTVQHILLSFGIMLFSIAGNAFANYRSTMLQCEAGYGTCADKRIEIAEHLKYLPMGYFNQNSLGYIASVATNSMETLADVATRVVMMVTQGILTTAVVVLMICAFDLRIGGIAILGVLLFFAVNSLLQKKAKKIAPTKDASDRKLVEKVLEYIQGIAEVKSYNLTGEKSKALNRAVDENTAANIKLEITFVPIMFLQSLTAKLIGVVIAGVSVAFYLNGTMELLNAVVMVIAAISAAAWLITGHGVTQALTAGVAVLDLDDFKLINDTYGHQAGDIALRTCVDVVRACIRKSDVLIRYGGDEFLLVLPGIERAAFLAKLDRIREQLHTASVPGYSRLQLSASIGGVITQPGETVEQVIGHLEEQADVAAYIKTLDFPVDIVSCEYHTAYSNPDLVNQLHAMGIQAAFWTVDTQDAVRSLLPLGPDCIVTNRPDRVREWVNAEMRK